MLSLSIVTPEKKIITDLEVEELVVPTISGEIGVLPGHAALMTTLSPGILKYKTKNSEEIKQVAVSWGYCEVAHNVINVLAETAERPEDVDISRAEMALKKSEDMLKSPNLDPSQIEKYQWKKERAMVRIAASKIPH